MEDDEYIMWRKTFVAEVGKSRVRSSGKRAQGARGGSVIGPKTSEPMPSLQRTG